MSTSTAVITGGTRGLGHAVALALAARGWHLVIDGRDGDVLERAAHDLRSAGGTVDAIGGNVADPQHRAELADAVTRRGGALDLLVNNASTLGPTPLGALAHYRLTDLVGVYDVNTFAPLALLQSLRPALERGAGVVVNVSSDAAVEPYETWGAYGSSKAALDQLTAIFGAENPGLHVYALDPGDMATDLQQRAFPGEDISDRADPASIVPAVLTLAAGGLPSGRYRAADVEPAAGIR